MKIEILYRPAHTVARVLLEAEESITAESGAMVSTSGNVAMTTESGGFKQGLKRLLGGESFFRNTFTAAETEGELLLAPALCGDMSVIEVGERDWFLASSTYVGGSPSVQIDSKLSGFSGFFSGAGVVILRASGSGQVILGSFGAMECLEIDGELIIDTGHLVAWEDTSTLKYSVSKSSSGWISSFLSGEGLVCRFSGRGKVWVQTRNPSEYGSLIGRLLPPRKS